MRLACWSLVAAAVAGAALWLVVLEDGPAVARLPEATPAVADDARSFVRSVRALDKDTAALPVLRVEIERLQSVMDFGARLYPGARGTIASELGVVTIRGSLPLPVLPARSWLNAEAVVAPYEGRPTFAALTVGGISLPPALTTDLLEIAANIVMGDQLGTKVRDAVPLMQLDGEMMAVGILSTPGMRSSFTRSTFSALRSAEMPTPERIRYHYLALRRDMDAGLLPGEGSFLPYLDWAIRRAGGHRESGVAPNTELTAVLFALTQTCGAARFGLVVGRMVDGIVDTERDRWAVDCEGVTLRGAIDKRRHFLTAATLYAASTMRVSFAIGEFKELVDSLKRRGRFDFTDIAANASGIRFAKTLLEVGPGAWPGFRARLVDEDAVLVSFDGVPGEISWADFETRFDSVDSMAYRTMITTIERRIDRLGFHDGQPPWDGSTLNLPL